ncbi:MAG: serine/threonine-protein phosphatase [Phycisphaeraceae bacterium]|nr:serine/threonine-protein phosphatase [Phycisphaeraceae bacterium]
MSGIIQSGRLQGASWRLLFVGIFFVFAPMPVFLMTVPQRPFSPTFVVISGLVGGFTSIGWAAAFVFRRYAWLALVAPGSFFVPWGLSIGASSLGIPMFVPEAAAASHRFVYIVAGVASIVAGYIILVTVIRRFERVGARSRAELDVARLMHESIVPALEVATDRVEVYARSEPSSEMGGDLIDLVVREESGEFDLFLADVSGHGVGAGIVMGMLKASIRTRLLAGGDLGAILTDVNRVLCDLTKPGMFATLACVRIGEGQIQYALAGHLPILCVLSDSGASRELENEHLPLGLDHPIDFTFGRAAVRPGDVVAIFSDGLVEVRDSSDREFGLAAANELIRGEVAAGAPLHDVYDRVLRRVREFGPAADDQSLLLIRIKRPSDVEHPKRVPSPA